MLLNELLKFTDSDHPDYASLSIALTKMKEIATLLNENKKHAEESDEVLEVYNKVNPKIPDLVEPHRFAEILKF
jgi:hypothetical protein